MTPLTRRRRGHPPISVRSHHTACKEGKGTPRRPPGDPTSSVRSQRTACKHRKVGGGKGRLRGVTHRKAYAPSSRHAGEGRKGGGRENPPAWQRGGCTHQAGVHIFRERPGTGDTGKPPRPEQPLSHRETKQRGRGKRGGPERVLGWRGRTSPIRGEGGARGTGKSHRGSDNYLPAGGRPT